MSKFVPTPHPLIAVPTLAQIEAYAGSQDISQEEAYVAIMERRESVIADEINDPLRHGWESSIWRVCWALLGYDQMEYGWLDPEYGEAMRAHLGFDKPVEALLINGGNRGSKSEFAAKTAQKVMNRKKGARVWPFHSSRQNSIEYQHPLFWRYMPREFTAKPIREQVAYISYKQKYGFSDDKFVLPNRSEASFRNYEQDIEKIEGGEVDLAWPDELVAPDWVETLMLRIATRNGKMIITFTPVRGYSATVKMFQDGSEVVKESDGFLCPKDGKDALLDQALVTENCDNWITDKPSQPPVPEGRKFEKVPRVLKCFEENKAVVFFHTSDNPYGNPESVARKIEGKPMAFKRERWYGIANKTISGRFPKFEKKYHCMPAAAIPEVGTNYLVADPANGRNFFMLWIRIVGDRTYVYREWPGNYAIPGIDVPGPWALPCGKKHDGKKGPAQDPFGFGLKAYKKEIARLEGWSDYSDADKRDVVEWDSESGEGPKEIVEGRFLDSRAASAPRVEKDRPVTLQDEFDDIGLEFGLTPGDEIAEGVTLINDLLDFDREQVIDYFNCPKLYISEECINLIFSLQNWTGKDGNSGACKDPIDVLRYAVLLGLEDNDGDDYECEGGGSY